jgi:hypothetical protein
MRISLQVVVTVATSVPLKRRQNAQRPIRLIKTVSGRNYVRLLFAFAFGTRITRFASASNFWKGVLVSVGCGFFGEPFAMLQPAFLMLASYSLR